MQTMKTRRASNGTGFSAEHQASVVRAIRGQLPPPRGARWFLDADVSDGDLATSHPLLGVSRYGLKVEDGALTGAGDGQFELALTLKCKGSRNVREPMGVLFRSASVTRPETFRYLAKGEIAVGRTTGIAVVRVHDLSWVLGPDAPEDRRILTLTATLERPLWHIDDAHISTPWLTRKHAEVFLHTEWMQEGRRDAA